jgi:hypothetical protein
MKFLILITIALTSTLIGCGGASGGGDDGTQSARMKFYDDNFNIDSIQPTMTITDSNLPSGEYSFFVEDPMGFCESGASFATSSYYVNDIDITFTPGPADENVVDTIRDFYPAANNGGRVTPYNNRLMNTEGKLFTRYFDRFYPATNVQILSSYEIPGITTGVGSVAYGGWEITFKDLRDGINYRASLALNSNLSENGLTGRLNMGVVSNDLSSSCFFSAEVWAKNEDYIPFEE